MKHSGTPNVDYKAKYYELRRTAKELLFENNAYQAEIIECHKMIAQRERERELLLQHLLQYEQEAWELQSEMANASTEKHKLLKKQQEADKRKRVRLDTHLAEAATIPQTEPDGTVAKIPKIKIVFQHKGTGVPPPQDPIPKLQGPVFESNTEAKTAIKNKLKRNKIDPIVISLPSMLQNKDPLQQQSVKRPRPTNLGLSLTASNLLSVSRASGLMLSPSLLAASSVSLLSNQLSSQLSSTSSLGLSPGIDMSDLLARTSSDHTPIDVFSESESSCNASPATAVPDNRAVMDNAAVRAIRAHAHAMSMGSEQDPVSFLAAIKRSSESQCGFRISPSALRSIKQKIDSINANQNALKVATKALKSPLFSLTHPPDNSKKSSSLTHPPDNSKKSDNS